MIRHGRIRRIHTAFLLLSALCCVTRAEAQVNIEALRPDDPPQGRSGSFSGNLTVRTGNVDFVQLGFEGRHLVVGESVTTLVVGDGGIGLLGGSRFASSGLFHFRRTHGLHPWISPEWYAQANYDRSRLLRLRVVTGAGVRTAVARGGWGQFGAGTGLMLEHERLKLDATALHPIETTVLRSSSFLTLRAIPSERLVITSTTYVQPQLADFGDIRILENLRLASEINEDLALTVSFDLRYDSRPPDGIAGLDTSLRTGITYRY